MSLFPPFYIPLSSDYEFRGKKITLQGFVRVTEKIIVWDRVGLRKEMIMALGIWL